MWLADPCRANTSRAESEHSALTAVIGAQLTGVWAATPTSSVGLAVMLEVQGVASGAWWPTSVSTCAGRGLELALRVFINELGKETITVIPLGCAVPFSGFGRETVLKVPGIQGNLGNTATYAAGIRADLEEHGKDEITVLGFAGDGATVDIGLQSLSGAMERGDRILYVCYDNEAYINTGIQGSASTQSGAWTTTTPAGKPTGRKDMIQMAVAYRAPYVVNACIGYMPNLRKKIRCGMEAGGPAYIQIQPPAPSAGVSTLTSGTSPADPY